MSSWGHQQLKILGLSPPCNGISVEDRSTECSERSLSCFPIPKEIPNLNIYMSLPELRWGLYRSLESHIIPPPSCDCNSVEKIATKLCRLPRNIDVDARFSPEKMSNLLMLLCCWDHPWRRDLVWWRPAKGGLVSTCQDWWLRCSGKEKLQVK